ncbi:DNA-binding protein Alba [Candidatus Bathyarchaeota archaeon]|nr:DNA-binding protein Alba [Candidatus Bathyarchaeota archaeon]MBS7630791.1 DNA-binding protein Alba [Candidatus Bathyarchaeota archaeon]
MDIEHNIVAIGYKPAMNYVTACITLFNSGASEVVIRARGRHICKAVDIVELLRRVFLKDLVIKNISLGTDTHKDSRGKETNTSIIKILLAKR